MFRPAQTLTINNATAVRDAGLRAVTAGQVDIDLAGLTVVDSSAVAVLLSWQRSARKLGRSLVFHHLSANLQSLVDLYGVNALLPAAVEADAGRHRA